MTVRTTESLRLQDYKDTDLLYLLRDLAGADGYVSSEALAWKIFPGAFNGDGKRGQHAIRCVSIRMAWMKRYGVVAKKERSKGDHYAEWELTPEGLLFMEGRMSPSTEAALEKLAETQLLSATEWMARRYVRSGDIASTLMRRMWMYGQHQRKK